MFVRFLSLFLSLGLLLLLPACDARSKIRQGVVALQEEMPLSLGALGKITALTDEDSVVAMTVVLNDSVVDVDDLPLSEESFLTTFAPRGYDAGTRRLFAAMAEEEVDFLLRYSNAARTKTRSLRISSAALKARLSTPFASSSPSDTPGGKTEEAAKKAFLRSLLAQERLQLQQGEKGNIPLVAVDTTAAGMVYTSRVDSSTFTWATFQAQRAAVKQALLDEIAAATDPVVATTYRLCASYGYSMTFVYTFPKEKKSVSIVLAPAELGKAAAKRKEKKTKP